MKPSFSRVFLIYKKFTDLLILALLSPVYFPLFLLTFILVLIFLGRPVFFRQERVGLYEKKFLIYKFRTMTDERDELGRLLPNELRKNKFGEFLRYCSLDELPSLLNVLIGNMTMVGPRPLLPAYIPYYNEAQKRRHTVKPGITGYSQAYGRNAISWEKKLNMDTYYVDNANIFIDLKILFQTFFSVIFRSGTKSKDGSSTMSRFYGTKTVLICGGGWDQCEIIEYSLKRGYRTIVADLDKDCPGKEIADKFYNISTRDEQGIREILEKENVDSLTYMITESPIMAISNIVNDLNLPGPSIKSAEATFSKAKMRTYLKESNIEDINFSVCKNIDDAIQFANKQKFPLVMKPSDVGGQLGLYFLNSIEDLKEYFNESISHSVTREVILEEFIEGPEINSVSIIINGKVCKSIFSDRIKSDKEGFGIVQRHLHPSAQIDHVKAEDYIQNIVEALEIKNAIIFPQFIKTSSGLRLCEIGERIPGGVMKELFEYATGIDLVDLQLDISLGTVRDLDSYKKYKTYDSVTVKFINAVNNQLNLGKVDRIDADLARQLPGVLKCGTYNNPNAEININPLIHARDRFYFIIAGSRTREESIKITNAASCLISFYFNDVNLNNIPFNMEP